MGRARLPGLFTLSPEFRPAYPKKPPPESTFPSSPENQASTLSPLKALPAPVRRWLSAPAPITPIGAFFFLWPLRSSAGSSRRPEFTSVFTGLRSVRREDSSVLLGARPGTEASKSCRKQGLAGKGGAGRWDPIAGKRARREPSGSLRGLPRDGTRGVSARVRKGGQKNLFRGSSGEGGAANVETLTG